MAELTAKEKKSVWASLLWLLGTLVHLPLWYLLLGYILWVSGAGLVGWIIYALYLIVNLAVTIGTKIVGKLAEAAQEEKAENERFINATPINRR